MITHRSVYVNGVDLHIAEAGSGPEVVLLHGFPELWYSWRHQLPALADAGYHAIAPDLRGHGRSGAPKSVAAYGMHTLLSDVTGLLDALGAPSAIVVGHDWGAQLAWACAELVPARFPAVVALSVPYHVRPQRPPTEHLAQWARGTLNWLLYFQRPEATAELDADPRRTLRRMLYGLSGDSGLGLRLLTGLPADATLLDELPEPAALPGWLTESDLDHYATEFARTGFAGGLNRYRNVDRDWHELPALGASLVEQPALLIGGSEDTALVHADWPGMRAHVPNLAEPVILPGCGHWVQQERAAEVNEHLIAFLAGLPPDARP